MPLAATSCTSRSTRRSTPTRPSYNVTVTNVKDLANNVIVANGTTNVGSFFIQNVTFNGGLRVGLCNGTFAAADTFTVEGSVYPADLLPLLRQRR